MFFFCKLHAVKTLEYEVDSALRTSLKQFQPEKPLKFFCARSFRQDELVLLYDDFPYKNVVSRHVVELMGARVYALCAANHL